jgi:translation initiation factor 2-alpha kinase 4
MAAARDTGTARTLLLTTPTEGYAEVQGDELEALRAIYMDDFEEVEAKGAWSV